MPPPVQSGGARAKPVILAVDDSPISLHALSAVLSAEYAVHALAEPARLEEALDRVTPDLILLDYHMPGRNGIECIPAIRRRPECLQTPILLVTSLSTMSSLLDAMRYGVSGFLVKPVPPEVLKLNVAKHLRR